MREEYPWMHEFLRSFTWTYQIPENGIKVSYKGSYDEILAKTENPGSAEKNNRKEILSDITAGLQFIFGKYWNPGCMERLKTVHRKADEVDENHVRTPFEAMDERERFLDLMNRLNFIWLYTNYRIVRDDQTPENEPVKKVLNLLHDIRTADPKKDPLSDETVDRIRTYFRKFAEEFSPYLKDSTDSNAFVLILYNMLAKTYGELKQKKQEACEANGTEYKPGETFAAFSEEADGAGEVLRKWYDRLDKKARQSPPLDILVYDRAFRKAIRAAEEDGPKKRGRKKRTDSVTDEAVLKETVKNSALNLMSDAEFEFLRQVAQMKVSGFLRQAKEMKINLDDSKKLSCEKAPVKLREDAADALEEFSQEDAILAYMHVDRSRAAETVEKLVNTIRNPLYPMQKKLDNALLALFDMTQDAAEFSKRCDAGVQFSFQERLEEIADKLGVDIAFHPVLCSLPERKSGEKLWLDVLIEKQADTSGITQERREQIFTYTVQILHLMFGGYLRPECTLRLAKSVRENEDAEAYRKTDEYELYHAYCCLVRECRGIFEVFLDECRAKKYVNREKAGQIEAFYTEMLDVLAAPEFPETEALTGVRELSKKAAAFCTEQQRMQFHENAADETLFDTSWTRDVNERYDIFKYHPVYSLQEQRYILHRLYACIGSVEDGMHWMYDRLWSRIFRLNDAAKVNPDQKHGAEKPAEPVVGYSPVYRCRISEAESSFLAVVCAIACGIRNDGHRITPQMISEKDRNALLAAAEALAQSDSIYYYLDISQSDRKHVRQIAEQHFRYPRACRISDIVRRFHIRSQELGLSDDEAEKDVLYKWECFLSDAADTTQKKFYKQKADDGDPILEALEEFAKKSRNNGFRTARKSSGKSGKK